MSSSNTQRSWNMNLVYSLSSDFHDHIDQLVDTDLFI